MNTTNNKLRLFLDVLLFGSIWGILEATLGTVLHLPFFDKMGMYMASSTIMVPIAFILLGVCYKRTGKFYALPMMGVVASLLKLSVAFVIGFRPSVYNPAIYIIVESLVMMGAVAAIRPTKVLSFKMLGSVILASTSYQFTYLLLNMAMGGTNIFASQKAWEAVGEFYLITMNGLSILYMFAFGAICFGVTKLLEAVHFEFKWDINKLIYSPITASASFVVALALTLTFAVLF